MKYTLNGENGKQKMSIANIDHSLFYFINQNCANPVLDFLCPLARDKNTWLPFYIIGGLMVLYRYRWMGLCMVICAVLAIVLSDQSSGFVKHFIHRLRPCATEHVRLLVEHCSDTFSFTSNHAANHFAIAVFLSLVFRRFKWLTYVLIIWAGFISLSQVYVGLHYPADIAGGAVIGVLSGLALYSVYTLFLRDKVRNMFISIAYIIFNAD